MTMNHSGAHHVQDGMTTKRMITGVLVAALFLLGTACGDDDDETAGSQSATTAAGAATTIPQLTTAAPQTTTTAAATAANTITIQDFAFQGIDNARANAGWTITNRDSVPHTVSATDGSFVWRVEGGQTGTFNRTLAPGSYPIRCDIHPARMTGTLVVR